MIPALSDISMISSGSNHNLAMDRQNRVYSWGFGEMNQLGHGADQDSLTPKLIASLKHAVMQVSAGGQHSIILARRK
jgi:regulator of chromosome condensation